MRSAYNVVLLVAKTGLPHNIKIQTTADSEAVAINNALYMLRKHGHCVFNVPQRVFAPHLRAFNAEVRADRSAAVVLVDEDAELWQRALNLRAFLCISVPIGCTKIP